MPNNPQRIEPMEPEPNGKAKLGKVVGGASVAALLIATVAQFEGKRNDPHWDRFAKIYDVCYGETSVAMRHYSDAECDELLADRLADDFAAPVVAANPELRGHPSQIVATSSLAYNIGIPAYRRSTVSREFRAGHWRAACDAFLRWSYAGGRQVKGLLRRRQQERDICLRGL